MAIVVVLLASAMMFTLLIVPFALMLLSIASEQCRESKIFGSLYGYFVDHHGANTLVSLVVLAVVFAVVLAAGGGWSGVL